MVKYYAKDYGIVPNTDIARTLKKLFTEIQKCEGQKTLIFDKGTYYINAQNCEKHKMYVTNTVGDNEYQDDEKRHEVFVALYLEKINNLVIDGMNSIFIINGKCTNMALIECENIELKNLEITHSKPDIHEFKVIDKTKHSVDFLVDNNTDLIVKNKKIFFSGDGYLRPVNYKAKVSWWNGYIDCLTPDKIIRHRHPLATAIKMKYLENNIIKAYYLKTNEFKLNDRYYLFCVRRDYVGIFADRCKNLKLDNIKQRVSYSLALVCQDCENIMVENIDFSPKNKDFKVSSVADFIQICMCRGDVVVKNSYFDGAGDDLINVHGVHFSVVSRETNKLILEFKHPQTHGYNPLRKGDTIAFIDKDTLLEKDNCMIRESKLINENQIQITVDKIGNFNIGDVVEDSDACPNFQFVNNKSTRIITRGILVTTRGKVVIENNDFKSTSMSGILLSDDAKTWYESGMCQDVTIRNNTFHYCGQTPILIKPENSNHSGYIHKNIVIENNRFESYDNECIYAKSSDNIKITGNDFANTSYLKTKNCGSIVLENNKVSF